MTSENTITGRNGKFCVEDEFVARTKKWEVSPTLATKNEWGDSDSGGYTNRSAGRRDATFTSEGVYDTEDEIFDIFQPEDILQSDLWLDNVSLYYDFPRALCYDFGLVVNVDTEEVIGWTSEWGADGIYYRPGDSDAPARTIPT